MRISLNASSATAVALATLSCTRVLARRSRRPKNHPDPTTNGTTTSVVAIRCGLVIVSSVIPPAR